RTLPADRGACGRIDLNSSRRKGLNMQIDGSVAVVTGGASGLGLATARRLAKAGGQVVLLDLPSAPGAQAVDELGAVAVFAPGDVPNEQDVTAALDTAAAPGPPPIPAHCAAN